VLQRHGFITLYCPEQQVILFSAKTLISYLLTLDPAHRYTASEVTSHPWTLGREDAESAPNQPNVLAMMKDYAKEMANSVEEKVQTLLFLNNTNSICYPNKYTFSKN